jgi:multicomponent K+:H+ antiporter subunit C
MSLELLLSLGVGVLVACGVYLVLRPRSFDVILGLTLLSYAVNLFIFASGRLTAIVISFGMTALLVAVAVAARRTTGDDRVDAGVDADPGREPSP